MAEVDLSGRKSLARTMKLSYAAGCLGTMWYVTISPQAIFNVFMANHLDASSTDLGLLVSCIQLAGIFQLASIFIYGALKLKKPYFIALHLVHRLLGLVLAFVALYVSGGGSKEAGVRAVIVALSLSWVLSNLSGSGWWSWMADLFPERIRGSFFLKRSAVSNIANVAWFFTATTLLDIFPGASSFNVYFFLFMTAGLAGVLDILLHWPIPEPAPLVPPERIKLADFTQPLRDRRFAAYSAAIGVAIFANNMIGPFQAPYLTSDKGIGAPNTWLGIMTVISQLIWVLAAPFWGTLMDRYGRKPVVVVGCFFSLSWIGYLLVTPANYIFVLPLIAVLGGFLGPAFWEGINQMMLSLAPERNRLAHVAWFWAAIGLISAGGSLVGGLLKDALAPVSLELWGFRLSSFHFVQAAALLMFLGCAYVISRLKVGHGGREIRPSRLVGMIAGSGLFKTVTTIDSLSKGEESGRVEAALHALSGDVGGLAAADIQGRLDDPDPHVREEAARALGRVKATEAVDALVEKLRDGGTGLRVEAAKALGRIGDGRAVEALAACMDGADEELQDACARSLGEIGGEGAVVAIRAMLKGELSERVAATGADAASRLGIFDAVLECYPRFRDTANPVLRRQYAVAIGNLLVRPGDFYRLMTGEGAEARLDKLFDRFERNVRAHAPKFRGPGKAAFRAGDAATAARAAFFAGKYPAALSSLADLSAAYLRGLFGEDKGEKELGECAFRADIQLGLFAWLMGRFAGDSPGSDAGWERLRLECLLAAYWFSEI